MLPRPTPHPHSGAQDGAVRPVVFCPIASWENSGYWVTLVRPWTANDGTLRQRELGERRKREGRRTKTNKSLGERKGCAKRSRKGMWVIHKIEKENIAKGYRENGGFIGWGGKRGVS